MKRNILFFILISLSILAFGQKLIDEDFTDGKFDDYGAGVDGVNWKYYGPGTGFNPTFNRSYDTALSMYLSGLGGGWADGAQWRIWNDDNNDGRYNDEEMQYFIIDNYNDIPVLKFSVFSDFLHKNNYAGVEVAFLEYRREIDTGAPHHGHDQSWESMVCFYRTTQASCSSPHQLETNVENTENCNAYVFNYAHKDNSWFNETDDLDDTYHSVVLWRNERKKHKTQVEQWGNVNKGQFFIDTPMVSLLDPSRDHSLFSYIQITFFRGQTSSATQRFMPGVTWDTAQIGITHLEVGIIKRADFNMDYVVDEGDADSLKKYMGTKGNAYLSSGDATNNDTVEILDACELTAFWSDTLESGNISASGTYNSSTGEIILNLDSISYFHLEGPSGVFTGTAPDLSGIAYDVSQDNDFITGAFTKNMWLDISGKSLGNIAGTGLNASDLYLVVNYKGSNQSKGFKVPLDGSLFTSSENVLLSQIRLCPNPSNGTIRLMAPRSQSVHLSVFNTAGKMLLDNQVMTNEPFSLTGLSSGLYIVKFSVDGNTKVEKLMIK